ncbi:glycosyltransferase family 4 protein [Reyranella soli]|jgi:glycosyltransferase involved in cell wall biosynthesis|uniref:glycosyltransferase family 4 protein n=1 Tax=Reyranella soli TaxID=1230389 RepID=UPI0011BEE037|nr:glycosyltransferase family 4 protein [Reyranella soli]
MRVFHLTTEFPPLVYGGLGTAIGGLVAASARAGIEVTVLLVAGDAKASYQWPAKTWQADAVDAVDHGDAGIHLLHASHDNAEAVAVDWLRACRADVLHLHVFWLWPLARRLRERTGIPIVYTVHSLDRAEYELGQGPPECLTQSDLQESLIASADRIVALTQSESALIAAYVPAACGRVRVVGNGIEDCPGALATASRPPTTGPLTVLYSGRFVERKGVRDLLAAVPLVLERAPNTSFVLAGGHRHCSGDDMARYWLPVGFERYRERVRFTGWLSSQDLARLYGQADVLVVPSWYEPFGMVVLEGMLYGLPIVASSVGGPAEILEHERTGLLHPPRDGIALAAALTRLIEEPGLRQRLRQEAAREVRQTWLYSKVVRRMCSVYAEMCTDASETPTKIGLPGSPRGHFPIMRREPHHVSAAP